MRHARNSILARNRVAQVSVFVFQYSHFACAYTPPPTLTMMNPIRMYTIHVRERITPCGCFRCLPSDTLPTPPTASPAFSNLNANDAPHRPPAEYLPPTSEPYDYIIFRANEVKEIGVEPEVAPQARRVTDDPAVLGVSNFSISSIHPRVYPDDPNSDVNNFTSESAKTMWKFPLPSF
jgi:hypothetical protein